MAFLLHSKGRMQAYLFCSSRFESLMNRNINRREAAPNPAGISHQMPISPVENKGSQLSGR